jgi:putative FmdB family regulatory protein
MRQHGTPVDLAQDLARQTSGSEASRNDGDSFHTVSLMAENRAAQARNFQTIVRIRIDPPYRGLIKSIVYTYPGKIAVPLYEYQCKSCHSLTERIQKFSDPPLTVCPHCGGELEQLISAPAVQFKGAGWYVTDYAKKSGAPAAGGNGTNPSSAPGSDTKSSSPETKPGASKSEASTGKDAT